MIYILSCIAGGFLAGWICRTLLERRWRRPPYSSAAIAFCATAEDAAKVRSKFIDPSVGEPWPEPMTVEKWARQGSNPPPPGRKPAPPAGPPVRFDEGQTQRGNGSGGPATPKPNIVPKPQFPAGRVIDVWGCTVGYIPRSQGGTPNTPPREP